VGEETRTPRGPRSARFLSIRAASKLLHCRRETLTALCEAGRISHTLPRTESPNVHRRIPRAEVDRLISEGLPQIPDEWRKRLRWGQRGVNLER